MLQRFDILHREQKIAMVLLALFVVGAGAMTVYSFRVRINRPFLLRQARALSEINSFQNLAAPTSLSSLTDDTDNDGLKDNDEVNIYKTSPYLDDTDSDGVKDGEEVRLKTDPNCPQGKTCAPLLGGSDTSSPTAPTQSDFFVSQPTAPPLSPEIKALLVQLKDPTDVRAFLLQIGVKQQDLDALDDEQLMAFYDQTLIQLGLTPSGSGAESGVQTTATQPQTTVSAQPQVTAPPTAPASAAGSNFLGAVQDLKNPTEIRKFLLQSGVPQQTLDQVNDEDLMKIFQDTLKQVGAQAQR